MNKGFSEAFVMLALLAIGVGAWLLLFQNQQIIPVIGMVVLATSVGLLSWAAHQNTIGRAITDLPPEGIACETVSVCQQNQEVMLLLRRLGQNEVFYFSLDTEEVPTEIAAGDKVVNVSGKLILLGTKRIPSQEKIKNEPTQNT